MSKVEEIKEAIDSLPDREYVELRRWFSEKDWAKWDMQIAGHSDSGKLDFFITEAKEAKAKNRLREL